MLGLSIELIVMEYQAFFLFLLSAFAKSYLQKYFNDLVDV